MPDNELSDFIFASYACAQPTVTLKGAMAVQSSTVAEGKIAVYANSADLPATVKLAQANDPPRGRRGLQSFQSSSGSPSRA
jgi:hypothetical protein